MSATTEADEFGAFARRIMRAYGRRVADRDIAALRGLAELRREVDQATRLAVESLKAQGYSWADIGRELGVSKQAAQQKWGTPAKGLEAVRQAREDVQIAEATVAEAFRALDDEDQS